MKDGLSPLTFSRQMIYQFLFLLDNRFSRTNPLIVLCYHGISKTDGWLFSVDPEEFKRQIDLLLRHFRPVSLEDLDLYLKGEKDISQPSFLLTFDDGYKDILAVKDYLPGMGVKPALFLLADEEEDIKRETKIDKPIISWDEARELANCGWTIGCHGARHRNYYNLSPELLAEEIVSSKKKLESRLERRIDYFAYPHGRYTPEGLQLLKEAGYRLALSMDDGFITTATNPYLIPRIGINRSHTAEEFQTIYSPSAVRFRQFVKKSPAGSYFVRLFS